MHWWDGFSAVTRPHQSHGRDWFKGQLDRLVDGLRRGRVQIRRRRRGALRAGVDADRAAVAFDASATPNRALRSLRPDRPRLSRSTSTAPAGRWAASRSRSGCGTRTTPGRTCGSSSPACVNLGLMGYPFTCPDLIGGGEYLSFRNLAAIDQELIVRAAQCPRAHADDAVLRGPVARPEPGEPGDLPAHGRPAHRAGQGDPGPGPRVGANGRAHRARRSSTSTRTRATWTSPTSSCWAPTSSWPRWSRRGRASAGSCVPPGAGRETTARVVEGPTSLEIERPARPASLVPADRRLSEGLRRGRGEDARPVAGASSAGQDARSPGRRRPAERGPHALRPLRRCRPRVRHRDAADALPLDQLPRHRGVLRPRLAHRRRLLLLPRRAHAAADPLPLQQRPDRRRRPLLLRPRRRRLLDPRLGAGEARPRLLRVPRRPLVHEDHRRAEGHPGRGPLLRPPRDERRGAPRHAEEHLEGREERRSSSRSSSSACGRPRTTRRTTSGTSRSARWRSTARRSTTRPSTASAATTTPSTR